MIDISIMGSYIDIINIYVPAFLGAFFTNFGIAMGGGFHCRCSRPISGLPTFRSCLEGETLNAKRKNPQVGSRPAYSIHKRWLHKKKQQQNKTKSFFLFFFYISAFWIPHIGGAWWKTSTAQIWHELVHGGPRYGRMNQIWHELVHGGPRYGRMNTWLVPLKSV